MERINRVSIFIMLLCSVFSIGFLCVKAEASDKEKVLRACSRLFGKPVDEKLNLFEINQLYVLRADFGKRDKLEELAVEPKYFFEISHKDWEEPDDFTYLSKAEYENLAALLDGISPKGVLIKPAPAVSVVTNQTAWRTEIYEKASLTRGVLVDVQREDDAPIEIKWFRLEYGRKKETGDTKFPLNKNALKKFSKQGW